MSFLIVGKEVCPRTRKVHWQGYAEFKIRLSLRRLKRLLGRTCHIETARKCAVANVRYCIKDGNISHNIGNAADPQVGLLLVSFFKRPEVKEPTAPSINNNAEDSPIPKNVQVQEDIPKQETDVKEASKN